MRDHQPWLPTSDSGLKSIIISTSQPQPTILYTSYMPLLRWQKQPSPATQVLFREPNAQGIYNGVTQKGRCTAHHRGEKYDTAISIGALAFSQPPTSQAPGTCTAHCTRARIHTPITCYYTSFSGDAAPGTKSLALRARHRASAAIGGGLTFSKESRARAEQWVARRGWRGWAARAQPRIFKDRREIARGGRAQPSGGWVSPRNFFTSLAGNWNVCALDGIPDFASFIFFFFAPCDLEFERDAGMVEFVRPFWSAITLRIKVRSRLRIVGIGGWPYDFAGESFGRDL